MMNINPIQLVQMIKQGQNPQQLIISILQNQIGNTPVGNQLIKLAKEQNGSELEKIARNLCAQRGLNFDEEFTSFKQKIGLL